ncbi:MAG: DUF4065 domain-containing protein [Deltaproteobacteria bacterium]|nr:DUF4065 domain-containing protein [Deltaproteobacteria bacterium]
MASVHDVAAYILKSAGSMTAMKLQKLVYYAQAWSLVWDDRPLFQARIEAWANGPVSPELYKHHRGEYRVSEWKKGKPGKLSKTERETVDAVLHHYGDKSSHWLSELTHQERPWCDARKGLAPGQRGSELIKPASMAEYYGSLV